MRMSADGRFGFAEKGVKLRMDSVGCIEIRRKGR